MPLHKRDNRVTNVVHVVFASQQKMFQDNQASWLMSAKLISDNAPTTDNRHARVRPSSSVRRSFDRTFEWLTWKLDCIMRWHRLNIDVITNHRHWPAGARS